MKTYRPSTLTEALEIRSEYAGTGTPATPMAGGTDLMVRHRAKNGLAPTVPGPVVFVDGIRELRGAEVTASALVLGASIPMSVLGDDPGCRADWENNTDDNPVVEGSLDAIPAVLRDAAASLGAPGLRQRAVLAGNIANASPAGDTIAALYALDAALVLQSADGERVEPISDFIIGPGRTTFRDNELITAVLIPMPPHSWYYWRKVGTRKANALTKVSLAACARIQAPGDAGGSHPQIASAAFAFGAVGPTVVRIPDAEALVKDSGTVIDTEAVLEILSPHIKPIDDQRSTAEYRKNVALNLAREALVNLASHR